MQKLKKNRKIIYWAITKRGFFSEVIISGLVAIKARWSGADYRIIVSNKSNPSVRYAKKIFSDSRTFPFASVLAYDPLGITWFGKIKSKILAYLPYVDLNFSATFLSVWNKQFTVEVENSADKMSFFSDYIQSAVNVINQVELSSLEKDIYLNIGEKVVIHCRGGDKLIYEAKKIHAKDYIDAIPLDLWGVDVIVVTDDYSLFEEIRVEGERFGIKVKTTSQENKDRGYDNKIFSEMDVEGRELNHNKLMNDFGLIVKSKFFIGTNSSNIGKAAFIVRRGSQMKFVDGDFSIFLEKQ